MRVIKQTINDETLDVSEKTKLLGAFNKIENKLEHMIINRHYLSDIGIKNNCREIIDFIECIIREMLIGDNEKNDSNKECR